MSEILIHLKKDLRIELRSRESLALIVSLSILLSVLVAFGVKNAFIFQEAATKLFACFVWLIFVFSATITMTRSHDYEFVDGALTGLLLSGAKAWKIYVAKVILFSVIGLFGHIISSIVLALLLDIRIENFLIPFLVVSSLVILGYASLAVLLSPITFHSRLKGLLLPLILIPLLFPLLFGALELVSNLTAGQSLSLSSIWISVILGLDVLYFVLGLNLYEFVISE